jgi:uncharacterized protein YegL
MAPGSCPSRDTPRPPPTFAKSAKRSARAAGPHKWEFRSRFRRRAFGWKSQPAIQRIKQAVSEITRVSRRDPVLAAEGAVLFLERVSPAIEQVDGSSGAIGTAVNRAIDALETRKAQYRENGISYYRPWIFLITDGAPNDANWEAAAERSVAAERNKAFAMFCVGTEGADFETLKLFSSREPLKLKGTRFRDLFTWLSSSQRSVSRSTPGDEVPLENPTTPEGWASIV